jgi:CBS domain-containing protein
MQSFFTRDVVTAEPDQSVAEVAAEMEKHNVGAVVVVQQQRPVGIITDRDIAIAMGAHAMAPETRAQQLMTCPVATIGQHDGIAKATQRIRESAARRLPVVDETGRLVGLVAVDDLLLLLSREMGNLAQGIRPEVAATV